jgi:hypothetical protein
MLYIQTTLNVIVDVLKINFKLNTTGIYQRYITSTIVCKIVRGQRSNTICLSLTSFISTKSFKALGMGKHSKF